MKYWLMALVLLCGSAHAELTDADTALLKKVMLNAKITPEKCFCDLAAVKTLPNNKQYAVVVVPEISDIGDGGDWFDLHSHVFVANRITGAIKSRYFESSKTNGWTSDAVRITDIIIDTARYYLNKQTRAFGVRVKYLGSSRPNPYSQEMLTLFIQNKKTLTPVLKNYEVFTYGGEFDGDCMGEFHSASSVIDMGKTQHNGFYDLLFTTTVENEKNHYKNDGCETTTKTSYHKKKLVYDKTKGYVVQK